MSLSFQVSGTAKIVGDKQTFGGGFEKRELVLTVADGDYPQDINLEFLKDRISLLDGVQPGAELTVDFNIRGREYNGRYYNNLIVWRMKVDSAGHAPAAPAPVAQQAAPAAPIGQDIPF